MCDYLAFSRYARAHGTDDDEEMPTPEHQTHMERHRNREILTRSRLPYHGASSSFSPPAPDYIPRYCYECHSVVNIEPLDAIVIVRILIVVLSTSLRLAFILLRGLSLPRPVNLTLSRSHHVERQRAFLVKVPTGGRRRPAVSHLNITRPVLDFVRHIVFWVHVADREGGMAEPQCVQGDELLFAQFRQMLLD